MEKQLPSSSPQGEEALVTQDDSATKVKKVSGSPLKEHRKRTKQSFIEADRNGTNGILGMTEHRALELLLFYAIPQGDVAPLARDLIQRFGSFANVFKAPYDSLVTVKGISEHSASLIRLVPSLYAYFSASEGNKPVTYVRSAQDAFQVLKPFLYGKTEEQVYLLCLDGENKVQGIRYISTGSMLSCGVNFRKMAQVSMDLRAVSVYLAHNHVVGSVNPSMGDWQVTERIIQILHPLDIYVKDHIIIGREVMASMRQLSRKEHKSFPWKL